MQAEGLLRKFGCKGVQLVDLLSRKKLHKLIYIYSSPWLVLLKTNAIFILNRRSMVRHVFLKAYYANALAGLAGVAGVIRVQTGQVREKVLLFNAI